MVASKKFTLKYMNGREEHYENYKYYERLRGNEKITRTGNMLYKAHKRFFKKGEDYWVEITKGQSLGSEFTLEFKDGSTKDFIGYTHHARLKDENKITRSNGRLYYQGKVFEQVIKDYWVETEKLRNRKKNNKETNSGVTLRFKNGKKCTLTDNESKLEFAGDGNWLIYNNAIFVKNEENTWLEKGSNITELSASRNINEYFTLEYKNGRKRTLHDFDDYVEAGLIEVKDDGRRMYCDGRIFVKIGENHWVEDRLKSDGRACKFRLEFMNGVVKEFENYRKCVQGGIIKLSSANKVLYYKGYRFTRSTDNRYRWLQDPDYFNKFVDKFYLINDIDVFEFENMQSHFDRQDDEHMELNDEFICGTYNKKPVLVSRSITYKRTKYNNVDNWIIWVAESPKKPKKEILNHSNKIPITKFYKKGVWYFTPDKKTKNYRHFLKLNEIYVFSNKYAFWSGALWEKEGKVWYYRKEMLKADKVGEFIIPIKEDEYYFKAEIKHLRKMGYKINYRYVNSKRQQPNKRNNEQQEDFLKKVKKMSRADRKKALNKKKKRQGKYRERRGL